MHGKYITPLYLLNIIFQSLFSLLTPVAIALGAAWLLVTKAGVGGWIYAVLALFGVITGLYSMIVFILRATAAFERLEAEWDDKARKNRKE
ncbi:MAG: ABC transporter ATP-binding protein [Clostridia bacterium]|nr:ABC transporter ATP-binding protein [Clostridia bacterium]